MDNLEKSTDIDAPIVPVEQSSQPLVGGDEQLRAETGMSPPQGYHNTHDAPEEVTGSSASLDNIQEILATLSLIERLQQQGPPTTDEAHSPARPCALSVADTDSQLSREYEGEIERGSLGQSKLSAHAVMSSFGSSIESSDGLRSTEDEDEAELLDVPLPNATTGPSTFAYEPALRNRIVSSKLSRGGELDTRAYTPTFIHDCLMLPGSLATVMGKRSPEDIIRRMTPALLPGFHSHIHPTTQESCIIQSADPEAYAQGMVIFGQSRKSRDCIHQHYRPNARRVKLQVEVELLFPDEPNPSGRPAKKKIWANAWLWSNVETINVPFRPAESPKWTLEASLAGAFSGQTALKIGFDGRIGEDYDGGESEGEGGEGRKDSVQGAEGQDLAVKPLPKREIVRAGHGTVNYERSEAAIGWW